MIIRKIKITFKNSFKKISIPYMNNACSSSLSLPSTKGIATNSANLCCKFICSPTLI